MTTPEPLADAESAFSAAERAAMQDRAAEAKAAKRRGRGREKAAADEADVRATIEELPEPDRFLARRLHGVLAAAGPDLASRLWYGMPAYARNGKIVCHFQARSKFNTRYATLGFSDEARLDDGAMWPVAYAFGTIDDLDDAVITALIERALG